MTSPERPRCPKCPHSPHNQGDCVFCTCQEQSTKALLEAYRQYRALWRHDYEMGPTAVCGVCTHSESHPIHRL